MVQTLNGAVLRRPFLLLTDHFITVSFIFNFTLKFSSPYTSFFFFFCSADILSYTTGVSADDRSLL